MWLVLVKSFLDDVAYWAAVLERVVKAYELVCLSKDDAPAVASALARAQLSNTAISCAQLASRASALARASSSLCEVQVRKLLQSFKKVGSV